MDVDCMLRGMQGRVSFHMPGHKGRFGAGSGLDVTELPMTDDLHAPEGAYRALAERLRAVSGAGISFPLVGGSTRGVQLMLLCGAGYGSTVILPRNAHLSAWSACVLGGLTAVSVLPTVDAGEMTARIHPDDVLRAMEQHPQAKAVLLTRPDYYGRMDDIRAIVARAHEMGMKVLVDEAHGAHFPYARLPGAGELGADFWVQSLHKTLPALTPCAVLHARDKQVEDEVRRWHHRLETSSPSSLLLHSMEQCLLYMEENGAKQLEILKNRCDALRKAICSDSRFSRSADFGKGTELDPYRLVLDVRGTGLSGYAAARRLEREGIDMEMADAYRVVGIPSVLSTQEDFDALLSALRHLPTAKEPYCLPEPVLCYGEPVCAPRTAALMQSRMQPLERAAGFVAAENIGVYPPGVPLCVAGEAITQNVVQALSINQEMGGTLFGVNQKGEIAVRKKQYSCVIFDLDGTLMDTSVGVMASVRYALRGMGLPDDDTARIRRFIGPPLHAAFEEFYGMKEADAAEAVRLYRVRYQKEGVLEYIPYPGMAALLRDLKAAGVKIGVATGKPEKFSRLILEREGLMELVDFLVTPNLSDTRDNKPEMVKQVLAALQAKAEETLMVGDRSFDILGAKANAVDSAGVTQGFGGEKELMDSGATYVVEGAQGLREILF